MFEGILRPLRDAKDHGEPADGAAFLQVRLHALGNAARLPDVTNHVAHDDEVQAGLVEGGEVGHCRRHNLVTPEQCLMEARPVPIASRRAA